MKMPNVFNGFIDASSRLDALALFFARLLSGSLYSRRVRWLQLRRHQIRDSKGDTAASWFFGAWCRLFQAFWELCVLVDTGGSINLLLSEIFCLLEGSAPGGSRLEVGPLGGGPLEGGVRARR